MFGQIFDREELAWDCVILVFGDSCGLHSGVLVQILGICTA